MAVKIALAGNPNCGKTTLFNALTGSNQFVGNWPGVTVEKKEQITKSFYHGKIQIIIVKFVDSAIDRQLSNMELTVIMSLLVLK